MTGRKKYKKMYNKYRKELKRIAKTAAPWDYEFSIEYLITFLKFMKEYYTLNYNVWAEDKNNDRLTSINNALNEYEAYLQTEDKYFIFHKTGGVENKRGLRLTDDTADWWIEPLLEDSVENHKAYVKEERKHWNNFWNIVRDNMRKWWD